jgi:hypothetical protein
MRPQPHTRTPAMGNDDVHRSGVATFILDNSLLLVAGTVIAVVWAHVELTSYDAVSRPLHFWVNDVGMVFFFALAAKEVFEATLPGGALASLRRALSPWRRRSEGWSRPPSSTSVWRQSSSVWRQSSGQRS